MCVFGLISRHQQKSEMVIKNLYVHTRPSSFYSILLLDLTDQTPA
jgi:hypothetical protein